MLNDHNFRIIRFEEIDSTNDEAQRMIIRNEISEDTVLISDKQIKSRGKNNAIWHSPKGNISMSLIFPIKEKLLDNFSELSLLTGLCVWQIINFYKLNEINLKIKYPNDLMINNKKIAGILIESHNFRDKIYVVIGIGINWQKSPLEKSQSIDCLLRINKEEFIKNCINNIKNKLDFFLKSGLDTYKREIEEKLY